MKYIIALSMLAISSAQALTLSWDDTNPVAANVIAYKVYKATAAAPTVFTVVGQVTTKKFDNIPVELGAKYQVTALNDIGIESDPSDTLTISKPVKPSKIIFVKVTVDVTNP